MSENENLDGGTNQAPQRPTFLTVLCILTFIGSGLGVLGGLLGLIGSSALATFSPVAGGSVIWSILALVAAGLCLFGAIQMFQLKKQGFMLYVTGSAISIAISIINAFIITSATSSALNLSSSMSTGDAELDRLYSSSSDAVGGMMNGAIWGGVIFGIAITIAFVLMYNANKKHLVK